MNDTVPAAFLSYSHFDDEHNGQYITKFRELLEREIHAQTGRQDFVIFQDWRDIRWGQQWKERIEQTLDSATFLIPILSPNFFASPECRQEVERFLAREKALARNDLILPIYYIDSPLLSDTVAAQRDSLAQLFNSRQYFDWRPLRLRSLKSQTVRQAVISLAQSIRKAVQAAPTPPSGPSASPGPSQPDQHSYPGTHDLSATGQPSDQDERRRVLLAEREAACQEEEDLLSAGQDATMVQNKILNLERQLREGHLRGCAKTTALKISILRVRVRLRAMIFAAARKSVHTNS